MTEADSTLRFLAIFNASADEIPLPDDPESGLLRRPDPPVFLSTLDPWPAKINGRLRRPPDDHLLDHLVRSCILGDVAFGGEPIEASLSVMYHPTVSTIVSVSTLPPCDVCGAETRYDAKMITDPRECWACLCPECYEAHCDGYLGYYHGRYVVTFDELSADFKARYLRAKRYWESHGVPVQEHNPWER